ncbi:MAG TPA: hypothetical protein VK837_09570 [Longimicrobiales bacterium]|nr:hypothetical protein [Longimicrobiales bacterium]
MATRSTVPVPLLAVAALASAVAALAAPTGAAAQTRTCTLVEGGTMNQFTSAGLGVIQQFGGPVTFRCGGAVLIRSSRATVLQSRSEVRLEGNVLYRDSVQELRTDWLQRRARDGFMLARGSVVMRDLESGSEIRGQTMERRDRAGTPTETVVTGRPHATLYRQRSDDAPADALGTPASDGAPIEVDADSLILLGANVFRARGNALFERGAELRGSGDALEFNDATGSLTVDGNARIDGERFDLSGDRVDALTVEGVIREVAAFGDAVLEGESMYLEAPEVYLYFERELLQSLEARGRAPRVTPAPSAADSGALAAAGPAAGDPSADSTGGARRAAAVDAPPGEAAGQDRADGGGRAGRGGRAAGGIPPRDPGAPARAAAGDPELAGAPVVPAAPAGDAGAPPLVFARAEGLEIRADSLHVVSPDERIETLTAVGMAHGVRLADSLAAAALPEGFADEWVRGDTVVARFVAPDGDGAAAPDGPDADAGQAASTASGEQILERLEAVGHGVPASALSHTAEDRPGEYTLNYLLARRILMLVRRGEAREVQAEGTLRGVYLTPDGSLREAADDDEGDDAPAAGGTGRAP